MLIALASAKGAPGTTTAALALALTWPRPVLLADLDPRGGDLAWGFGQGRDLAGRGLLSLHVAARHQPMADAVWPQVVALAENCWLLPGIDEPRHAGTMDWAGLARALTGLRGLDVIADCGAVPSLKAPTEVWTSADLVALVVKPTLPGVHSAQAAAAALRTDLMTSGYGPDRLVSIVTGPGRPYTAREVTEAMASVAPTLGSLPWDERSAAVLAGIREMPPRLRTAPLLRRATALGLDLGGAAMDHQRPAVVTTGMTSPTGFDVGTAAGRAGAGPAESSPRHPAGSASGGPR